MPEIYDPNGRRQLPAPAQPEMMRPQYRPAPPEPPNRAGCALLAVGLLVLAIVLILIVPIVSHLLEWIAYYMKDPPSSRLVTPDFMRLFILAVFGGLIVGALIRVIRKL